jgi:hypothetical protein
MKLMKLHEAHIRDERTGEVHVMPMDAGEFAVSEIGKLPGSDSDFQSSWSCVSGRNQHLPTHGHAERSEASMRGRWRLEPLDPHGVQDDRMTAGVSG